MTLRILAGLTALVLVNSLASAPLPADDKVEAKGDKVAYDEHTGHFEKNTAGLKGDSSYLALTDAAGFDKIFGIGRVMGKPQNFVKPGDFDKKMVLAVIKRGKSLAEYTVQKVTAADGVLYVQYEVKMQDKGGTATFASPLILTVDKGKYKEVVFIENGKKADTVAIK
jgi:hypothetical protein